MRRWHPQEIVRQLRVVGSVVPAKFSAVTSRATLSCATGHATVTPVRI